MQLTLLRKVNNSAKRTHMVSAEHNFAIHEVAYLGGIFKYFIHKFNLHLNSIPDQAAA